MQEKVQGTALFENHRLTEQDKQVLVEKRIWQEGCPVSMERLRLLMVSYVDFSGAAHHDGKIMVLDAVAEHVLAIFQALYQQQFPLASVKLINDYNGDDAASMEANNCSSFNYRKVIGGSFISIHAYGLAIDINPVENPFLQINNKDTGDVNVSPFKGVNFLNRTHQRPGMAEPVVNIFKAHGFHVWGGHWNEPIDWQHFQPSRAMAEMLAGLEAEHAKTFFELSVQHPAILDSFPAGETVARLLEVYQPQPQAFINAWQDNIDVLAGLRTEDGVKFLRDML